MQKTTLAKFDGRNETLSEFFEKRLKRTLVGHEKMLVDVVDVAYNFSVELRDEGADVFLKDFFEKTLLLGVALLHELATNAPGDEILGDILIKTSLKNK